MPHPHRLFVLSPASLRGVRGGRILAGTSGMEVAVRLERGEAVPIGDVYESISSLYYRGKRAYARRFARPPGGAAGAIDGIRVVTADRGLVPDRHPVTLDDLRELAEVDIGPGNAAYLRALRESAARLARRLAEAEEAARRDAAARGESARRGEGAGSAGRDGTVGDADEAGPVATEVVLLGSIATGKYLDPLRHVLGARLRIPEAFVGRGDMSRGGLLLRAVESGEELVYVAAPSDPEERRGRRPPKLPPV